MKFRIIFFFFIFLVPISFDLFSKYYIRRVFDFENKIEIIKINFFLDFHVSCNKGISFSLLKNFQSIHLTLLTFLPLLTLFVYIIILLIKWYKSFNIENNNQIMFLSGMIFIFSGALGNFIDRIQNSCVLDFLDLHINDLHFFIFNLADFFISFGFFMILVDEIKKFLIKTIKN